MDEDGDLAPQGRAEAVGVIVLMLLGALARVLVLAGLFAVATFLVWDATVGPSARDAARREGDVE